MCVLFSVGHIVGIALSAVVLVLLVLMFCCCCCPFCMLAKNKEKSGSYFGRRSASRNAGKNLSTAPFNGTVRQKSSFPNVTQISFWTT